MLEIQEMMSDFLEYFQILCLALFLCLFVGRTVHIHRMEKVDAITLTVRSKGWQGFLELSLFIIVNVWIVEVLMYSLQLDFRIFPYPLDISLVDMLYVKAFGVTLIVLGFTIFISALMALGNAWRLGIDRRKPGKLVTGGIYTISRNPIYIFFDLYFLGTFLVNGTLIFLLFTLVAAANLHYQIIGEEVFLQQIHGQRYVDYRAATRRYINWGALWSGSMTRLRFTLNKLNTR